MFIPLNKPTNHGRNRYESLAWFIIGAPMSGKSSFANGFPNPLLINTDGNFSLTNTPSIYLDKDGVLLKREGQQDLIYSPWEYFKYTIDELTESPDTTGFKTLIIDLIEDVYDFAEDYICKAHNKKKISDVGAFGHGYKILEEEFFGVMKKITKLRMKGWNILFLSHEKIQNKKTTNEIQVETIYGSSLREKVQNKLQSISDITGRTDIIKTTVKTDKGPVNQEHFILRVNEIQSLASNRVFLPFNYFGLTYNEWKNIITPKGEQNA